MRFEIRDTGEHNACLHCGAHPLLYAGVSNKNFERDLDVLFDNLIDTVKWWQLGRKSHLCKVKALKDELINELREQTITL